MRRFARDKFYVFLLGGGTALLTVGQAFAGGNPPSNQYAKYQGVKAQGKAWWPKSVEKALTEAGENRTELRTALEKVPTAQRDGMRFLIENMPSTDLKSLKADFLLENVALAYKAYEAAPWKNSIPKAVFLNDVLPYASLNEQRDDWRKMLNEKSLPLISDCRTPAEAAHRLNQKLFPLLNARYSTERKKPDQSPLETIASGKATCSGLSILLVDACRAVGIPARVVGTPLWTNMRGNHTWVEIWDGDWHFLGAAEPDENGLDHGWFVHDASQARKDLPQHSIYASSFAKTGVSFPLVWDRSIQWVPAVNVTDRYAAKAGSESVDASKTRLMVNIRDTRGKRIVAKVHMVEKGKDKAFDGQSKGEGADMNDLLVFEVWRACPPREYLFTIEAGSRLFTASAKCGMTASEVVELTLDPKGTSFTAEAVVRPVPVVPNGKGNDSQPTRPKAHPAPKAEDNLIALLTDRFGADEAKRVAAQKQLAKMPFDEKSRELAWQAYKTSPVNAKLREEFEAKTVTTTDRTSPYLWRHVGTKPKDGWGLVIAMHGGGNAPKEVNDSQWQGMFERYYKDHPEAGGYVYLALRAPNDTWNGFYDDSICPLVERLIKQFVLFDDVNPNKVYTLGASHGGYGAFVIGPKIPYRFAAVHASASAPTDGETRGENLRNTRFTWMVGEQDTAYGRAERCLKFAKSVEEWRAQHGGGYPGQLELKANTGHFVPDRDKVAELMQFTRDVWPKHLVWAQSDNVLKRFFWIEAENPSNQGQIEAIVTGNMIIIKAMKQEKLALWLNQSLVDLKKPILVQVSDASRQEKSDPVKKIRDEVKRSLQRRVFQVRPDLETFCLGLDQTADPFMAAPVRIVL